MAKVEGIVMGSDSDMKENEQSSRHVRKIWRRL